MTKGNVILAAPSYGTLTRMTVTSMTVRNYRCFAQDGATLSLRHEFTGIVGLNNSGKSTILRVLYEIRPITQQLSLETPGSGNLSQMLMRLGRSLDSQIALQILPGERIESSFSDREPRVSFSFEHDQTNRGSIIDLTLIFRAGSVRMNLKLNDGTVIKDIHSGSGTQGPGGVVNLAVRGDGFSRDDVDWNAIRPDLEWLASAMYVGSFRNAVNSGGASYYDLSIGHNFIGTFNEYKNGDNYRQREAVQIMLSRLGSIFQFSRFDLNASADGAHLTCTVDNNSFRVSEFGSGLSHFVIVATNVLVRRPTVLLIDEPEIGLHASLQSKFLELLAENIKGPVIFATHSLGLARSTADRILVTAKNKGAARIEEYHAATNLSATLGELGYGGLPDSAFKGVLLVEGVTEVRVFRELLTKYGIHHEILIVQLGGDDLATGKRVQELDELRRLSENVWAVVDSEKTSSQGPAMERRLEFQKVCVSLDIECTVLDRRAIENYLDQSVARKIFRCPDALAFGPYEVAPPEWSWDKERNWRIAQAMSKNDIKDTDLDRLLTRLAEFAST